MNLFKKGFIKKNNLLHKYKMIKVNNIEGKGVHHEIEMYEQQEDSLCWAAITEALAKFFKVKGISQDILLKKYKNVECDPINEISKIMRKTPQACILKKGSSLDFDQFKKLINIEGPVVFTIPQDKDCSSLHYIIAVGYIEHKRRNRYAILKDPHPKPGSRGFTFTKNKKVETTTMNWFDFEKKICGFLYTKGYDIFNKICIE